MDIGTIASIIAAIVGTITLFFTIRNSKWNILKRIARKEQKIHELNNEYLRTYGLQSRMNPNHPIYKKIKRLEKSVEELKMHI